MADDIVHGLIGSSVLTLIGCLLVYWLHGWVESIGWVLILLGVLALIGTLGERHSKVGSTSRGSSGPLITPAPEANPPAKTPLEEWISSSQKGKAGSSEQGQTRDEPEWYVREPGADELRGPFTTEEFQKQKRNSQEVRKGVAGAWMPWKEARERFPEIKALGGAKSSNTGVQNARSLRASRREFGHPQSIWRDEGDTRRWDDFEELREIVTLGNELDIELNDTHIERDSVDKAELVLRKLDAAMHRHSDLQTVYFWKMRILLWLDRVDQARAVLALGLEKAKKKSSLCNDFAENLFRKDGSFEEAVDWWLVSAFVQANSSSWRIHGPFLWLSHIAKLMGETRSSERLMAVSNYINSGRTLDLHPRAQLRLASSVSSLGSSTDTKTKIRLSLRELSDRCPFGQ